MTTYQEEKESNLRQLLATEFTAQPVIPTNGTFLIFFFFHYEKKFWFTFMLPVQLPLHEPYFDLTLIRTGHTKNSIKKPKPFCFLIFNKKANLLPQFLSACDEWLVPIRGYIHRVIMIHDYQQFLIHAVEFQTTIHFRYFILFFEIS